MAHIMAMNEAKIKRVSKVGDAIIKRPSNRHPNPEHWAAMQIARRSVQTVFGTVHCGTCDECEGGDHRFELHHRHYDNWGNEKIEDVILLCVPCHDAITSRIRSKRFAAGDMSVEYEIKEHSTPRYLPKPRQINLTPDQKEESAKPSFRPASRYTHG